MESLGVFQLFYIYTQAAIPTPFAETFVKALYTEVVISFLLCRYGDRYPAKYFRLRD